ncbi:hypothetical protein EDB89DRAFT_2072346 [Lactarius sanguifluus]|nr:hypothetical protein EDB89DRAFT_2072346 [Lactarius sanguifluus]
MSTNPPAVDTQVGVSQHRSSLRFSSATSLPSGLRGSVSTPQSEMMTHILRDFSDATFLVDLTAEGAPLQTDSSNVREVLNCLDSHNIIHGTLLGDAEDAPRLSPNGFPVERNSYVPLTHFLNAIVRAAKERLTPWAARHLSNLRFLPHDEEMLDAVDSKGPLKPNILGLVRSHLPRTQKIFWNDDDVAVVVEVKHGQRKLVSQLSACARCYLSVDRRRSFSIAIAFDHQTLQMQFLVFHRSGLSSSHELSLHSEAGFQSVVKHIVGILSIPDEAFGLDQTRSGDVYRINDRDYEINCPFDLPTLDLRIVHPACTSGTREAQLPDGMTELPEEMVYKLSYQTEGHSLEGELLSGFLGQFGIVDIVGSYVCTSEDATAWTLWLNGASHNKYLHCTAMALEGLPLLYTSDIEAGIPSPAELLETILHAMIGHYNLFLGGVLHRDVSDGSILRLREPIERPHSRSMSLLRPELGKDVNLTSCRGLLADLDHSIEWRKVPPRATLPFIAWRLVNAWSGNKPALHTAADDLESFMWVLVWSLVHIFKKFARITIKSATINRLAHAFSSYDPSVIIGKGIILELWPDQVFGDLIREWLGISSDSRRFLAQVERSLSASESRNDVDLQKRTWDGLEEYCGGVYIKFIRAGYAHLENIRGYGDWEAVIDKNGGLLNE